MKNLNLKKQTNDFALQDYLLFGQVYSVEATEAVNNIEHADFALNAQPVTYVITLQVRQFYKLEERLVTRHMGNLEATYGAEAVEETVKMFFPNFHARYYGAE
jgi:hypothetical protein